MVLVQYMGLPMVTPSDFMVTTSDTGRLLRLLRTVTMVTVVTLIDAGWLLWLL